MANWFNHIKDRHLWQLILMPFIRLHDPDNLVAGDPERFNEKCVWWEYGIKLNINGAMLRSFVV